MLMSVTSQDQPEPVIDEPFPDEATLLAIEKALCELITDAAKLVLERRGDLKVEYKGGKQTDPVTEVDRAVEAYLSDAVAARFPDHAVLGEEGQDSDGTREYEWIVDPVDGTLNYVTHLPLYAISVGVLHRRRPVAGAILFPVTGELLHARRGGGAFRNGEPVKVREETEGLLACLPGAYRSSFKAGRKFRSSLAESRSLGSIAYETAMVGSGSFDLALFRGPKIWDIAGGLPIVTEAGGTVLYHSKRLGAWQPLDRFVAPRQGGLRAWKHPVLLGSSAAIDALRAHIEPRYPPALLVAASSGLRAAKGTYMAQRAIR